mmetsp:Transcript_7490/g.16248  ORF Transcript_7490/g.16248 Transcript_7490/m.16248 type:complete len:98 (-) Transcript_7490:484-777(-)
MSASAQLITTPSLSSLGRQNKSTDHPENTWHNPKVTCFALHHLSSKALQGSCVVDSGWHAGPSSARNQKHSAGGFTSVTPYQATPHTSSRSANAFSS